MGFINRLGAPPAGEVKPETAKDRKFFDLRESGYKGPVDQDGNAVEDLARWIKDHS